MKNLATILCMAIMLPISTNVLQAQEKSGWFKFEKGELDKMQVAYSGIRGFSYSRLSETDDLNKEFNLFQGKVRIFWSKIVSTDGRFCILFRTDPNNDDLSVARHSYLIDQKTKEEAKADFNADQATSYFIKLNTPIADRFDYGRRMIISKKNRGTIHFVCLFKGEGKNWDEVEEWDELYNVLKAIFRFK